MNFQWYPGHMTKAKRQMQEDIKLIDLVIELVDARIPLSSRNPDIDELGKNKSRLILLNKADLADESKNKVWKAYFQNQGFFVVELDARKRNSMKIIQDTIMESCKAKIERDRKRGIKNRPIRAMVVGIPNVGKSTFINTFAGKAVARTGNKPGVTKGKQWIRLNKNVELLDTPGILWPKFDDQAVGMRLAFIGSMNDNLLNIDELSLELIRYLTENYPGVLAERYSIREMLSDADDGSEQMEKTDAPKEIDEKRNDVSAEQEHSSDIMKEPVKILEEIAVSRNCIRTGGELDYSKAAALLLDDFRSGRLGRITLEVPV
ncbi:MAG: ribosome biogenesis GTPase YlqF [Clostridiales bacterium]|nr:ribosome biogenesis GTPase YlqF [Clostridiales bacterium]